MTAMTIKRNSRPLDTGGPIHPMSPDDEQFWRLRKGEPVPTRFGLQRLSVAFWCLVAVAVIVGGLVF